MKFKELKKNHDSLWKRYESLGEAHTKLAAEYNQLSTEHANIQLKNKQLLQQLEVRDRINQSAIENQNKQNNEYLEEIQRLRDKLNGN